MQHMLRLQVAQLRESLRRLHGPRAFDRDDLPANAPSDGDASVSAGEGPTSASEPAAHADRSLALACGTDAGTAEATRRTAGSWRSPLRVDGEEPQADSERGAAGVGSINPPLSPRRPARRSAAAAATLLAPSASVVPTGLAGVLPSAATNGLHTPLTPNGISPLPGQRSAPKPAVETLDKETGERWSSPVLRTAEKQYATPPLVAIASANHRAAMLLRQGQCAEAESVLLEVLDRQRPRSPPWPEGARSWPEGARSRPFVKRTPVKDGQEPSSF